MTDKLGREELLEELKFMLKRTEDEAGRYGNDLPEFTKQAYKEIVAILKKEVTEEFVRKWATSICEGVRIHRTLPLWQGEMAVRKMLEEAGVRVV